jgi:polyhydroxyalkanoate synthase
MGRPLRNGINDLYRNNLLVKGRFTLRGQTVKLKNITCPVLALAGQKDLIVIEHQVQAIVDCVSSRMFIYHGFNTGHGGLAFGSTARGEVYTYLANWLNQRSELKNRKRTG